jgi:hypothetical protein
VQIFPLLGVGDGHRGQELVFGVVPDGVSSVEVKADEMPGRIIPVRDNFFEVQIPTGKELKETVTSITTSIIWYDTAGKRLKTITHTDQQMNLTPHLRERPPT